MLRGTFPYLVEFWCSDTDAKTSNFNDQDHLPLAYKTPPVVGSISGDGVAQLLVSIVTRKVKYVRYRSTTVTLPFLL